VTPLRNKLLSERCDQIIRIITEGGREIKDFDFGLAITKWRAMINEK
jgi:hypothetical protein